MKVQDLS